MSASALCQVTAPLQHNCGGRTTERVHLLACLAMDWVEVVIGSKIFSTQDSTKEVFYTNKNIAMLCFTNIL